VSVACFGGSVKLLFTIRRASGMSGLVGGLHLNGRHCAFGRCARDRIGSACLLCFACLLTPGRCARVHGSLVLGNVTFEVYLATSPRLAPAEERGLGRYHPSSHALSIRGDKVCS
jgi:hypothetical protein